MNAAPVQKMVDDIASFIKEVYFRENASADRIAEELMQALAHVGWESEGSQASPTKVLCLMVLRKIDGMTEIPSLDRRKIVEEVKRRLNFTSIDEMYGDLTLMFEAGGDAVEIGWRAFDRSLLSRYPQCDYKVKAFIEQMFRNLVEDVVPYFQTDRETAADRIAYTFELVDKTLKQMLGEK